ncbi:beta-alanyl-dopamine/carcinine hydrolase-like [Paramacrobiotus metropolitanus]|uniref:beta-alanyl-dopamine/carcinine hydrolase-like n=1 Tax=Paramacrobiotus metropolitanus TaxID=2943436 RepID=UPI002445E8DE|nr:beta-alanyl-dopamine/carcinine hydrolase-like [Paramacrobiotus metropolitanus]
MFFWTMPDRWIGLAHLVVFIFGVLFNGLPHADGSVIVPFWPLQMRPFNTPSIKLPPQLAQQQFPEPLVRALLRTWRPYNIPKSYQIQRRMTGSNPCASGSHSLPLINVRGTNYQVGFETGRLMREHIQAFYASFAPMHHKFLPFIRTDKGRRIFDGYLNAVRDVVPQYLEEIRGISDGSGVPFEQVFCMHIRSEISLILRQGHYETPACSTVFVNRPEAEIVGHNEDNDPEMKARSYMVSAEILAENGTLLEKFTAFSYPGCLPGNAFSFNRAGIIFTVNSESPIEIPTNKIPRYIMNRALLSAESPEDFERIISTPPGLAQGCSINVVFTRNPNDSIKMRNYELLGSFDATIPTVIDRAATFPYDLSKPNMEGNGYMYHWNKYERIRVKQNPDNIVSSVHRQNRAKQFPVPQNVENVLNILGDTADADYPIYRTPNEKDGGCTIAVALFDLRNMTLSVYRDNPKTSSPLLTLPIPKLF